MLEIYFVQKWNDTGSVWNVAYCPTIGDFSCNCQRMESLGLPCHHIIIVLVILEKDELPSCLNALDDFHLDGRAMDLLFFEDSCSFRLIS